MEDATLDCAHRNPQFICDFIIMKPIEEHGEWLAEVVLQTVNGTMDVIHVDQCRDRVVVVILTCIQEILILRLVDNGILEALALVVVDKDVPHDGVQPPFDVGPFLEIVLVTKGLDESLLDQIIGILTIASEAHGEAAQEILMADEKVVEFDRRHLVQRSDPKIRQSFVPCKILFNFS